ncbi:hypothetical protein AC1031_019779 [Aphanomyces cochlioides]|nr:hypothetical protein AC1031_019779 [Aphanomyces cochlioides]
MVSPVKLESLLLEIPPMNSALWEDLPLIESPLGGISDSDHDMDWEEVGALFSDVLAGDELPLPRDILAHPRRSPAISPLRGDITPTKKRCFAYYGLFCQDATPPAQEMPQKVLCPLLLEQNSITWLLQNSRRWEALPHAWL